MFPTFPENLGYFLLFLLRGVLSYRFSRRLLGGDGGNLLQHLLKCRTPLQAQRAPERRGAVSGSTVDDHRAIGPGVKHLAKKQHIFAGKRLPTHRQVHVVHPTADQRPALGFDTLRGGAPGAGR